MSFVKIQNTQSYLKSVIFGDSGTGKTTLGVKIAIGLCAKYGYDKVAIIDTEGGADFFTRDFNQYGIEAYVSNVNSNDRKGIISDIQGAIKEGFKVMVIDSISHIGALYEREFVSTKDAKLTRNNWGTAKKTYKDDIVNYIQQAPMHILVCGREGAGENGKPKVKMGLDIDYELNMLIQTTREFDEKGNQYRAARILKDRSAIIDGLLFKNATFEQIKPHLDGLNHVKNEAFEQLKCDLLSASSAENPAEEFKKAADLIKKKQDSKLIDKYHVEILRGLYKSLTTKPGDESGEENTPPVNPVPVSKLPDSIDMGHRNCEPLNQNQTPTLV